MLKKLLALREEGFTLIELLMGMSIFVIVMVSLFAAIQQSLVAKTVFDKQTEISREAKRFFELLYKEIKYTKYDTINKKVLLEINKMDSSSIEFTNSDEQKVKVYQNSDQCIYEVNQQKKVISTNLSNLKFSWYREGNTLGVKAVFEALNSKYKVKGYQFESKIKLINVQESD